MLGSWTAAAALSISPTAVVHSQHLGQQPEYLPTARGFDAFLGLPFSVDDGLGVVIPATCPHSSKNDSSKTNPTVAAPASDDEVLY